MVNMPVAQSLNPSMVYQVEAINAAEAQADTAAEDLRDRRGTVAPGMQARVNAVCAALNCSACSALPACLCMSIHPYALYKHHSVHAHERAYKCACACARATDGEGWVTPYITHIARVRCRGFLIDISL